MGLLSRGELQLAAMTPRIPTGVACFPQRCIPHPVAIAAAPSAATHSNPSLQRVRRSRVAWELRCCKVVLLLAALAGPLALGGHAAVAASTGGTGGAAVAKPHLGQKLALFLQTTLQLPNWAILIILSALPLIELRGGVPVGLWMGLRVPQVMLLCIVGNMIPIPLILCALRSPKVSSLLKPLLRRAQMKTKAIGAHDQWVGVAAFVGVPLPGTGAWTGAMVAHLLGMELRQGVTSTLAGVCVASIIMASLTLAGWYGCAAACCLLGVAFSSRYLRR